MGEKWHGGKGDRRRSHANDEVYREGWDQIFKNDKVKVKKDDKK